MQNVCAPVLYSIRRWCTQDNPRFCIYIYRYIYTIMMHKDMGSLDRLCNVGARQRGYGSSNVFSVRVYALRLSQFYICGVIPATLRWNHGRCGCEAYIHICGIVFLKRGSCIVQPKAWRLRQDGYRALAIIKYLAGYRPTRRLW